MLAVLALLAAIALPQEALKPTQDPRPAPAVQPRAHRDPLKRFEALNLNQDQQDRMRNIFAKGSQDRRERRKAMLSVLTPEQRRKLREQRRAGGSR